MGALITTPLTEYEIELGAKMVPRAGWNVPLAYPEGIIAEHRHTRTHCSVFDLCASGKLRVAGAGAAAALDGWFARPVADLEPGRCRRNLLLNEQGGVLGAPLVARMGEEDFLLLTEPEFDAGSLSRIAGLCAGKGVETQDLTRLLARIALAGPKSRAVLETLNVRELPEYGCAGSVEVDGFRAIAVHAGSTGEEAFSLLFNLDYADQLWDLLLETEPVMPEFTPAESGLGALLHPEEPREFTGRASLGSRFPGQRLFGVRLDGRRAAREGTLVLNARDEVIGRVTSGSFCPSLDAAAALCRLEASLVKPGESLRFEVTGAVLTGTVVPLPFYDGGSAPGDWWLP